MQLITFNVIITFLYSSVQTPSACGHLFAILLPVHVWITFWAFLILHRCFLLRRQISQVAWCQSQPVWQDSQFVMDQYFLDLDRCCVGWGVSPSGLTVTTLATLPCGGGIETKVEKVTTTTTTAARPSRDGRDTWFISWL